MARFIMAGRAQAVLFVILFGILALFLPPISLFSNAAIALVTLRLGWQQGVILSLIASVTLGLVTYAVKQDLSAGIYTGLLQWLPVLVLAMVLRQTVSWSKTLQVILLLAGSGVVLFHAYMPDTTAYWTKLLSDAIKPLLLQSESSSDIEQQIKAVAPWMTGILAAFASISWVLSLFLARHWQAMLQQSDGFIKELHSLRVGKVAAIATLVGILLILVTKNALATELVLVALAVFLFQGLGLVHGLAKQLGMKPGWIIGLYVLIFVLTVHMSILLAAFGIIDSFADFRTRLVKK
jgi:hypothetical protein